MEIKTERLSLHPWREEEFEPFATMCADPKVMESKGALKFQEWI